MTTSDKRHVVIVGGGFAGLGCAQRLADHDDVLVTLIDRNNYHQFQPLLYQVATSQLAPSDIANSLRGVFAEEDDVDVKLAEISDVDPATRTITSTDGERWSGTRWCSRPGRSQTSSAPQARPSTRFRCTRSTTRPTCARGSSGCSNRSTGIRELIQRGALNFVIVGGGPTGVEVAGAIADMVNVTVPGGVPRPRR